MFDSLDDAQYAPSLKAVSNNAQSCSGVNMKSLRTDADDDDVLGVVRPFDDAIAVAVTAAAPFVFDVCIVVVEGFRFDIILIVWGCTTGRFLSSTVGLTI